MKRRLLFLALAFALFLFDAFALASKAGQPEAFLWGSLALASLGLAWFLALPLFPQD